MANGGGIYGRGLTKQSILQSLRTMDNGQTGSYWDESVRDLNKYYDDIRDVYSGQFNEAIDQAYASKRRRDALINMSTVVGGGKQALLGQSDLSYQQAYDSYVQNLAEQNQSLLQSYSENLNNIQATLDERAENFATFGNLHYDYLKYLYDKYYLENENPTGPWTNDVFSQMYLTVDTTPEGTPLFDDKGNAITDESGNQLYEHLRSRQSLYNVAYDDEGTYNSIYDKNGFLTPFGRQYFDMIENMEYGNDAETFGDWLYQKDQDLWEYMYQAENIFDKSSDKTNAGTFRELTGRSSRDYTYSIAEHFGALSKGTIKGFFNDIYSNIENTFRGNLKDRGQSAINNSEQIVDQIAKLTKDLGLETEFGDDTWESLKSAIKQADSYVKSGGEMTLDWFTTTYSLTQATAAAGVGLGLAVGAIGGGTAGTALLPGLGTAGGTAAGSAAGVAAGAIIGGIVGLIGGIITSSVTTDKQRKVNEQYASQLKSQLQSTVDQIVAYSLAKRDNSNDIQKYLDQMNKEREPSPQPAPTRKNTMTNLLL